MAVVIDQTKCEACGGCVNTCPGDLFCWVDGLTGTTVQPREASECWDCLACVKQCPGGAITTRLPFSIAGTGATLMPRKENEGWIWTLRYPDGTVETYTT